MLLCKMSKKKEAREVISFSFLIASGIIGTLLGSLHELPASSNCPSPFMSQLWKILLPLVTSLYEMQWLEVLVPTLTGNSTMPLKTHLSASTVKHRFRDLEKEKQQRVCSNVTFSPSFWSALILNKVLHTCCQFIWILLPIAWSSLLLQLRL